MDDKLVPKRVYPRPRGRAQIADVARILKERSIPRQIREADQPGARHHRADVLPVEAGVGRDEGEPGARRLKERERENGRLKRAVADLTLDKLMLEEAAEGNF